MNLNLRALWQALHTLAHPCRANDAAIERHVAAALSSSSEGVGTGAGEGAPRQDTGSAWVTRSEDCPEAPAQAHSLGDTPLADAALDFLRTSLAALDAMETVDDFVWLTGGDA